MTTTSWNSMNICKDTPVVIDVECFRYRNHDFIVKEIAVCADYLDSISLQAPFTLSITTQDMKEVHGWYTDYLHRVPWYSGQYPYEQLYSFLKAVMLRYPESAYFAKGTEKCQFLERLTNRKFIDIERHGCPRVDQLDVDKSIICNNYPRIHKFNLHCAKKKAKAYHTWIIDHFFNNESHHNTFVDRVNDFIAANRGADSDIEDRDGAIYENPSPASNLSNPQQ